MNVIHFDSPQERLRYLKGKFEEIEPKEVVTEEVLEAPKPKKKGKAKGEKNDKVQAK